MAPLFALFLATAPQKTIFNGRDLAGWEGDPAVWSVKEGAIVGVSPTDPTDASKSLLRHNTFLVWKGGTPKNFELKLRYRISGGNSGVQYRSRVVEQGPDGPIVQGYQADIDLGTTYSGALYEERGRGMLAERGQRVVLHPEGDRFKIEIGTPVGNKDELQKTIKTDGWNEYRIVAQGNRLRQFLNGRQTVEVTDEDAPHAATSGVLALQLHAGPAMRIEFREIRLREL